MAWATSLVLMVIWLMGLVTGRTLHGFVHLLPVVAGGILMLKAGRAGQGDRPDWDSPGAPMVIHRRAGSTSINSPW
jgi:hypothetical protein